MCGLQTTMEALVSESQMMGTMVKLPDGKVPVPEVLCNQTVTFSMFRDDNSNLSLSATMRSHDGGSDHTVTIPFGERFSQVQSLIFEGFHLHEKTLLVRHGIGFLMLHTSHAKTPDSHYLLCVDMIHGRPIGHLAVSDLQSTGAVQSLEVFSADVSRDRRYVAFAVGVVTDRSYMYWSETGHCFILLYDMDTWSPLMRIETGTFVTPSVAFDKSSPYNEPRMTVIYSDNTERPMMATYDVAEQRILRSSVFGAIDLDGDTTTQAVYTEDGCYIILLVLEDMWHDKTSLCRLFAIRASSLTLYHRYPASVVRPCHPDCVFTVMPVLQQCGTRFMVQGTRIENKYTEQTYNVPAPMGLKAMCRMTILRHVKATRQLHTLPLPNEMCQYLSFKGPTDIC